jgi:hypothetical protein
LLTAGGGVQGFVPQSDLVVFVTSAERPITETEGKLLQYISEWGKKVVMVLNKIDLFEDEESLEKVKAFVRENAANILGVEPPVFGVAGRLALQAKLGMADPAADQACPPPPSRTNWTRLVPPSVLIGHVSPRYPGIRARALGAQPLRRPRGVHPRDALRPQGALHLLRRARAS